MARAVDWCLLRAGDGGRREPGAPAVHRSVNRVNASLRPSCAGGWPTSTGVTRCDEVGETLSAHMAASIDRPRRRVRSAAMRRPGRDATECACSPVLSASDDRNHRRRTGLRGAAQPASCKAVGSPCTPSRSSASAAASSDGCGQCRTGGGRRPCSPRATVSTAPAVFPARQAGPPGTDRRLGVQVQVLGVAVGREEEGHVVLTPLVVLLGQRSTGERACTTCQTGHGHERPRRRSPPGHGPPRVPSWEFPRRPMAPTESALVRGGAWLAPDRPPGPAALAGSWCGRPAWGAGEGPIALARGRGQDRDPDRKAYGALDSYSVVGAPPRRGDGHVQPRCDGNQD